MKQVLEPLISQKKSKLTWATQNLYCRGPITMKHYSWVRSEINKLLDAQLIFSSHSSWSAPIIEAYRGDICKISSNWLQGFWTKSHRDLCSPCQELKTSFQSETVLNTLDLHAWYHHIPLNEDSILKMAFTSPFGKYKYWKVPFVLAQAPAYSQELMNKVLKDFPFTIAYLNDVIYRRTTEEHLEHLQQVFHKLCDAKLLKWASAISSTRKFNIWAMS